MSQLKVDGASIRAGIYKKLHLKMTWGSLDPMCHLRVKNSANLLITDIFHIFEIQTIVMSLLLIKKFHLLYPVLQTSRIVSTMEQFFLQVQLQGIAITTLINSFIKMKLIFLAYILYNNLQK